MSTQAIAIARLEEHFLRQGVTLKPTSKRAGAESWFPYYAGYSATFVRETLAALGASPGWRVLDPWNGSGTTTTVADASGCDAIGFDLNPVAALVAAARLVRAQDALHSSGLASEMLIVADRNKNEPSAGDPLRKWLSARLVRRYRRIEAAILALLGSRSGTPIDPATTASPPFAAFFLLCLMRAAKRFTHLRATSNPTWMTPERRGDAPAIEIDKAFLDMVDACARDTEQTTSESLPLRATSSRVGLADARSLPLSDATVDAVITSPPYCTRIDYFRATHLELSALKIDPRGGAYRALRSAAMGTNLLRTTAEVESESLPEAVQDFLSRVRAHPSKASNTYYYRSLSQYFDDAMRSLREVHRVLKPGSCAVFVVQSSYYKEIPISLGELYSAMADQAQLEARIVHRVPVKRVLTTINSRASRHCRNRHYTEDVVAMLKRS
ncbi:MAG: hypothetical protein HC897_11860 [Thermoanaerobaculia bacterium]|nr:hypothetical protein [Thermoanaerobaculia bacterium]